MFLEKYPLYVNVANGGTMYEKKSYRDNVFVESAPHWKIIRAIAGIKHFTQVLSTIFEYNLRKNNRLVYSRNISYCNKWLRKCWYIRKCPFRPSVRNFHRGCFSSFLFKMLFVIFNAFIMSINLLSTYIFKQCLFQLSKDSWCLSFHFLQIRKPVSF